MTEGQLVEVGDTKLFVDERGAPDALPLIVLHGGPGCDHHMFGDYLDPLTADGRFRLLLVDERCQGRSDGSAPIETWTIEQMTSDITDLAESMNLERYAVLGHSFGSLLALQHAVSFPRAASATIVSAGVASARWFGLVDEQLANFEPVELRQQVSASWANELSVRTESDAERLLMDQMPFHFRDPRDPRIDEYFKRTAGAVYAPDVLRHFAESSYGGIEVEEQLTTVPQPVLVLSGRYDRTCSVDAGALMAARLPDAEFVIFEESAHMLFVEEPERYITTVADFLTNAFSR